MKLKYFKQLMIFIVLSIIISILLFTFTEGLIWLIVGLIALFVMSGYCYLASLKDINKDTGKHIKIEFKLLFPLVLYYIISVPIGIIVIIINDKILSILGLIMVLIFISFIMYWGMKRILKE